MQPPSSNPVRALEQVLEQLNRHTLAVFPNRLAQLLYLSSTRNLNTGRFQHEGLEVEFGGDAVHEALTLCRDRVYRELALLSIRSLSEEIRGYCACSGQPLPSVLAAWSDIPVYWMLAPENLDPLVAELFSVNLRAALTHLREASAPDPTDAPPPP